MGNEKPPAFSFLDAATECDCERETTGANQKVCRVTGNLSKIQSPGALRLRTRRSASPRAVDGGDGQQPAGGVGSAEFSSAGVPMTRSRSRGPSIPPPIPLQPSLSELVSLLDETGGGLGQIGMARDVALQRAGSSGLFRDVPMQRAGSSGLFRDVPMRRTRSTGQVALPALPLQPSLSELVSFLDTATEEQAIVEPRYAPPSQAAAQITTQGAAVGGLPMRRTRSSGQGPQSLPMQSSISDLLPCFD